MLPLEERHGCITVDLSLEMGSGPEEPDHLRMTRWLINPDPGCIEAGN
jgi:hypothetical protein